MAEQEAGAEDGGMGGWAHRPCLEVSEAGDAGLSWNHLRGPVPLPTAPYGLMWRDSCEAQGGSFAGWAVCSLNFQMNKPPLHSSFRT